MWSWIAVGVGGALGSMARFGVNRMAQLWWESGSFPIATTVVNLSGSVAYGLFIGAISTGAVVVRPEWRDFILIGLLGGFTTFSTFSFETWAVLRSGNTAAAVTSVAIQMIGGVAGLALGFAISRQLASTWGGR